MKEEITETTVTTTETTETTVETVEASEEPKKTKEERLSSNKPSNKKLDKFSLSIGLKKDKKEKGEEKPGFLSKMFCASKPATDETIIDPQTNPPDSP